MEPLIVRDILQSKLVVNVEIPDVYPQVEVVQMSLVVDSSLKLTNKDWIREKSDDSSLGPIIQLLKSDKLKNYVVKELDLSGMHVLIKYGKDLFFEGWAVVLESSVEKPLGAHFAVCVTPSFCV